MGLLRYGHTLGVDCFGLMGTLDWEDKTICVMHGEDRGVIRRILDEQQYDYLLLGHDLMPQDKVVGRTAHYQPGGDFRVDDAVDRPAGSAKRENTGGPALTTSSAVL